MSWRDWCRKRRRVVAETRDRAWLRRDTGRREVRYQRGLVIALALLLLGSLAPVVGGHILGVVDRPLSGSDHIGALCLIALHEFMAPVHRALHVVVAAGLVWAIVDRIRLIRRARRTLQGIRVREWSDGLARVAQKAGLDSARLVVVDGLPLPAFTLGSWSPQVYISSSLLEGEASLTDDELVAVLAHEAAHARRRDPLRFAILRALSYVLFWVPALRQIAEDIADEAEIAADDSAGRFSDPLVLANALVKLGAWRIPSASATFASAVPGFLRKDMLDRRVRRLIGADVSPRPRSSGRALAGAVVMLVISTASGVVDVHALPSHGALHQAGAHCAHEGVRSLAHLFCRWGVRGALLPDGGRDCPHRGH